MAILRTAGVQLNSRNIFVYILTVVVLLQLMTLFSLKESSAPSRSAVNEMLGSRDASEEKFIHRCDKQTWRPSDNCKVIHITLVVWNQDEARKVSDSIKTILHSRSRPLHFHILVSGLAQQIMSILLDTWEMIDVEHSLYLLSLPEDTLLWKAQRFVVLSHLPTTVREVIFMDNSVRLLSDISLLVTELQIINDIAISTDPDCVSRRRQVSGTATSGNVTSATQPGTEDSCYWPEMLYFNRSGLTQSPALNHLTCKSLSNHTEVKELLERFWNPSNQLRSIPCVWTLRLNKPEDIMKCLQSRTVQGVVWSDSARSFRGSQYIERLKDLISGITFAQPLPRGFLYASQYCSSPSKYHFSDNPINDTCAVYRYISSLKHRTHIHYLGTPPSLQKTSDPYEVTMLVQTSLNRFNVLEVLLKNWKGPAAIVFYVTDEEASTLPTRVQASSEIRNRKNTVIHVVYRRNKYNPINYLRNVAVDHVTTPYLLTLDVDLVPNPDLYNSIKRKLPKLVSKPHELLLVPAFEAFVDLKNNFPSNKKELLKLMSEDQVDGYRMRRGWKLGHKPTNFPAWKVATEPYRAIFHDAFEPYTVVPRSESARYHEGLLERMGDKIAYSRLLHGKGYEFLVLPEDFIVHMPHPIGGSASQIQTEPMFLKCAKLFFDTFREELYQLFPNRTF